MLNSLTCKPGLYLSFDFGTKRIGIAIGQSITQNATPLKTIANNTMLWSALEALVQEWQPQGFVIGLALQPDGTDSTCSLQAKAFGQTLAEKFAMPIFYIEERLTSVEANRMIKTQRASHDKDALAASLILESWFNSMRESQSYATN